MKIALEEVVDEVDICYGLDVQPKSTPKNGLGTWLLPIMLKW